MFLTGALVHSTAASIAASASTDPSALHTSPHAPPPMGPELTAPSAQQQQAQQILHSGVPGLLSAEAHRWVTTNTAAAGVQSSVCNPNYVAETCYVGLATSQVS